MGLNINSRRLLPTDQVMQNLHNPKGVEPIICQFLFNPIQGCRTQAYHLFRRLPPTAIGV